MRTARAKYLVLIRRLINAIDVSVAGREFAHTQRLIAQLAQAAAELGEPPPIELTPLRLDELPREYREEPNPQYRAALRFDIETARLVDEVERQLAESHPAYANEAYTITLGLRGSLSGPLFEFVAHGRDITEEERRDLVTEEIAEYVKHHAPRPGPTQSLDRWEDRYSSFKVPQTRRVEAGPVRLNVDERVIGLILRDPCGERKVQPLWHEHQINGEGWRRGNAYPFSDADRQLVLGILTVWEQDVSSMPIVDSALSADDDRKRKADDADAQQAVVKYISERINRGTPARDITRDGIAEATGISGGRVSATKAWKAFRALKDGLDSMPGSSKSADGEKSSAEWADDEDWERQLEAQQREIENNYQN